MARESVLGEVIPVLDQGWIEVLDVMGDDHAICEAARVSTGSKSDKDERLIRRLMKDGHTSPFEMAEIKLRIHLPIVLFRQWVRHRTANVAEVSGRYRELMNIMWAAQEWRTQDGTPIDNPGLAALLSAEERELQDHAWRVYRHRLEMGVSRELARKDLPLSLYTIVVWKNDLHNLLHFIRLRIALDAQVEMREYARVLLRIVDLWCPLTAAAFREHQLGEGQ